MWRVGEWLAVLWPRSWWYSWRHARHVLATDCDWCRPGARCTCRDPGFYGSMNLADELEVAHEWPPLLAAGVPDEWDAVTLASLRDDPRPEATSLAPGPAQVLTIREDWTPPTDAEIACRSCVETDAGWMCQIDLGGQCPSDPDNYVPPEPTRLADTDDIAQAHGQPSRWLTEQLAVLRAWSEWQQQKAALG